MGEESPSKIREVFSAKTLSKENADYMRIQILKLRRGKSTKAERKFMEILKQQRIKFRTKVKIQGCEVDFLIGDNIIEIRNSRQRPLRNKILLKSGHNLFYLTSEDVKETTEIINFLNFLN